MADPFDPNTNPFGSPTFDGWKKLNEAYPHVHSENEHLGGFAGWHFFDIGSDILRSSMRPLNRMLERFSAMEPARWGRMSGVLASVTSHAMRILPVVGLIGETAHVYTPFQNAHKDWQNGILSNEKYAGLCAIYTAYALTGLGGLLTSGAKEGITYMVQKHGLIEDRYIPHTLYKELQHAGILEGDGHSGPVHHHAVKFEQCDLCEVQLATLPSPITPAQSNLAAAARMKK